ncbi:hypothetical protein BFW01_g1861 [Lasiodiplodia theobromae]|uniref:Uncharacterized protein n=1 Tax=Lasiodiplodia theobromae TaxID=45133 RepID=A0A8H7IS12_9PEZI|nr:hypothetical protein BFW01_g1861 [Lasiodiplodia theobromae]
MRFTFSVITLFLAAAIAAPTGEPSEDGSLLMPRCLAKGTDCIINDGPCCAGSNCIMDKGRATYTCQ